MANTREPAIAGIAQTTVREVNDYQRDQGYPLYLSRMLDELPGAVFVAMTLAWIITALCGLVW
jgi:hypothetical protein